MATATDTLNGWTAEVPFREFDSPFGGIPSTGGDRYISPAIMLSLSPFADHEDGQGESYPEAALRETFGQLRSENFHEAVASLAEELETAVDERFEGEDGVSSEERERFGRSYLAPLQFEADQYLASLEAGLAEVDPANLSPEALDEALDRYDPPSGELSPAGEEFIGGLVKKAKGVVRRVAKVAKQAAKLASPLLAPMLKKLRGLVRPLLERVLRFAIGKLPAALQPAARTLADRILGKAGSPTPAPAAPSQAPLSTAAAGATVAPVGGSTDGTDGDGATMAPAQATDTGDLADSFDLSLAEAIAFPDMLDLADDEFGSGEASAVRASDELEVLVDARRRLIERLASGETPEQLGPEIERFVPALLTALRVGIKLVGRPKVVSFLAGYLAKAIAKWVGPMATKPLSQAIVDAGLRMVSLEAEGATGDEANDTRVGPVAMASVIEDAVRRLVEAEDYLFEDRDLTQLAIAEAFGEAAATYLPQATLREDLQLAPSLGGRFVTQRSGKPRSYAKYSRVPEVTVSARAADALPAFGGGTLGGSIRAAGGRFPLRARVHIFHAKPGANAATMMRHGLNRGVRHVGIYPLTRRAAGTLLREPDLGAASPPRFLGSQRRIGAGQRLYVLEPLDQTTAAAGSGSSAPGRAWVAINPTKARITLGFFLSEADAQLVGGALRGGRGHGEVLRRVLTAYRAQVQRPGATGGLVHEDGEDLAGFAARHAATLPGGFVALLRKRIAAWALPALSAWLRENAEAFQRAVAHPDQGVRILIRLHEVPGLAPALAGGPDKALASLQALLRGKPKVAIAVEPGGKRR